MYSLVAGGSPLPVRTMAEDRDAIQRLAIREASLTERGRLAAVSDQGASLATRVRRAIGLAPAIADGAADCVTAACAA